MPALRMANQPDQVIDFGKVGFSEAENQVCAFLSFTLSKGLAVWFLGW